MIRQLYRLFFWRSFKDALPRLHERGLTSPLDYKNLDWDVREVLMAGLASDEAGARRLLDRYGAQGVDDLIAQLPKRQNRWREKLRGIAVRIEGGWMENPHKREFEEFRQQRRR